MRYYKKDDVVEIYKNYQRNEHFLGKARLISFASEGLPFILEDYTHCPVFNTEKWQVKWLEKVDSSFPYQTQYYNIRYIMDNTIKQIDDEEDEDTVDIESSIPDRFIKFDGTEAF